MRHVNCPLGHESYYRGLMGVNRPYELHYTYAKATPKCKYIQVFKFIADNPGLKRREIVKALWPLTKRGTPVGRAHMNTAFACWLYDDMIDYDKNHRYYITKKGLAMLARANG